MRRSKNTRWIRPGTIATAALLVLVPLAIGTPAVAAATPTSPTTQAANDAAGVVYPITSFLDWLENPVNNITDIQMGTYAFGQILDEAEHAVTTQAPDELAQALGNGPNAAADAEAFSEQMASQLIHLRPRVLNTDLTDVANPEFLPDFDHNGVYGDPGDYQDDTANPDANGYFLYPCIADSGAVTYETTSGTCASPGTAGDTYQEGLAQELTIVDSRGLDLAATLWLPGQALKPGCPAPGANAALCTANQGLAARSTLDNGQGLPVVVIAEGIASAQNCYYWLAMTLAKAGDIVLTYDPAGQGASEGSVVNLFSPSVSNCTFGGACRDLEDVMRWIAGDPIDPSVDLAQTSPLVADTASVTPASDAADTTLAPDIHNPGYTPAGSNVTDPVLGIIDTSKLAVVGHSMGALSLLNYLDFQGHGGTGVDGALPPLATGIALSGGAPTTAVVPVQFQTSDYDGSPSLVGPEVAGVGFGTGDEGIGYSVMKPLYDQLRTSGPGAAALSMIVLEGGVHTDFIDTPFITRTPWSLAVSAHYATSWMGCFLDDNFSDCLTSVVASPHLSSSYASEAAPSGTPLPHVSRCITVPTTAALSETPADFLQSAAGHPIYTCVP
ncbi:MAG TPA: hypothetical protein VGG38_20380 [Acidimicrobiales bacterium]|jgi:pimeloyl-ACP methyl ester carboxylesterase